MKKARKRASPTGSAEDRLAALLNTPSCIPFHVDLPDKEYPFIKLSIYGSAKTNELFVKITNGRMTFVETLPSPLLFPAMADRIWGMDAEDSAEAFRLADTIWERHKIDLIQK